MHRVNPTVILLLLSGWLMITPAMANESLDFNEFFSSHSTPMLVIDIDVGEILKANPAAKAFYGFEQLEGMFIDEINMLNPRQIEEERRRAAEADNNHLFFRHRLASGEVRLMGVYTDRFEIDGRDVLVSSLYDTSDFAPAAERHYIARVEEQVDLQTAQLSATKQRQFWFAVAAGIVQALVIVILLIVLLRLKRSYRENHRLVDELSFRNRELERMGHVMAHHFQEPSRRLVSFAQQISREVREQDNSTLSVAAGFIHAQAKRLSHLVSDVQRYLSLDRLEPVFEYLNTQAVLEKVYQHDKRLAKLREQQAMHVPQPLPDVYFDARRLELIFFVLLHNAWLYQDPSRPLRVEVLAKKVDGCIEFRVADNGTGIAPEYRNQVLELFSRLVPNTEQLPGTGIGLTLAVKALRPAGGHLCIEDGVEGGTAIVFDLPATR